MTRKAPVPRIVLYAALTALVLLIVPTAFAGKGGGSGKPSGGGGGGGSSSFSLVLMNSSDGLPHWGQQVTFNVSTSATNRPYVNLDCTQNGKVVYSNQVGYYAGYPWVQYFVLSSTYWASGAADCTAALTYWNGRRWSTITSMSIHVYA